MAVFTLPFVGAVLAWFKYGDEFPWVVGLLLLATGVFAGLVWQFFRVPKRRPNLDEASILSPCDGKVVVIEETHEHEFIDGPVRQISIFMSPLNVHVNYFPVGGKVVYHKYHPGLFLVAWHPKSSTDNERNTVVVEHAKGSVLFRQIAGAVARRIICYSKAGDAALQAGEMGFIKFGSRVDVMVPMEAEITVAIGDKVKGRMSELARWT